MASDELFLMVLESVANDYEQLEQIADQIAKWTDTPLDRLDVEKIRATLADAIDSGYIDAYEINSHAVRVAMTSTNLHRCWFLISELGKARCRETSE